MNAEGVRALAKMGKQFFSTSSGCLTVILICASFLLFYRLGELKLDKDEALIVVWATEVHDNAPTWSDLGRRIISERGYYKTWLYPGLNIYLIDVSFRLFGLSPWAARLPSALIGLLTIPAFYLVARRLLANPTAALIGTILLASSAPILFLMRQCRYTSLTIFAGLWLIWAYLDLMNRKRSGIWHGIGAMVLFYNATFYLFLPVLLSVGLHSLLYTRGAFRRKLLLAIAGVLALVVILAPSLRLSASKIGHDLTLAFSQNQIAILYKLSTCLSELNLFGIPFLLVPIYLYTCSSGTNEPWVKKTSVGLALGYLVLADPAGQWLLREGLGGVIDWLIPSLSPWLFNRLVDYRSWLLLGFAATVPLCYRQLQTPMTRFALSIPVLVIFGVILTYSLIPTFRMPWTRYLANPLVASFLLGGFLLAGIMDRSRPLAVLLLLAHVTTNLLSVIPFTPEHYPYLQWKLPHWGYRLLTGDPITETITNFVRLPPL